MVNENNVTSLDAYKIADLITEHWLDEYSDNGAIWERSRKTLEVVRNSVTPDVWDEAIRIAQNRWGQS
jgi:hypothetical protein